MPDHQVLDGRDQRGLDHNGRPHFDAVVVGAGPAGAAAALVLARSGRSVALLERGAYPGAKNMYGGSIQVSLR